VQRSGLTELANLLRASTVNWPTKNMDMSEQMRQVLLDTVKFALSRNHQCCKSDGLGNEVDLQDAKAFLEGV
jgi:hypothetical protein